MTTSDELPLDLLGEPLRGQIDWLRRRHHLTAAGATITALVGILGVVGPSRRILDPQDLIFLPASMSVVMSGSPISPIRAALNICLDPIRQWLLGRVDVHDRRRVRLRIADLREQLLRQEFHLRNAVRPQNPEIQSLLMSEKELEANRENIRKEIQRITSEINDQSFRLKPFLIADNVPIRRLLDPGELSHDGAVLAVSLSGDAETSWTQATRSQKAELRRLLTNSWQGLPDVADETRHLRPQLSAVVATDPRGVEALQKNQDLAGVCSHLIFVPALEPNSGSDLNARCPDDIADEWVAGLQALVSSRIQGEIVNYRLSAPAVARFQQYLESEPGERHPTLCLKSALLIHCGSHRDETEIALETVEFAIALAAAVSTSLPIPRQSPDSTVQLESLVAKVRLRGPLRWRELLRGCHPQKADHLIPLLDQAIASGRLRREGDLYYFVDTVSTSENP